MILAEAYKSPSADTSTPSKAIGSPGPPRRIKRERSCWPQPVTLAHKHKHVHTWTQAKRGAHKGKQLPELTQPDLPSHMYVCMCLLVCMHDYVYRYTEGEVNLPQCIPWMNTLTCCHICLLYFPLLRIKLEDRYLPGNFLFLKTNTSAKSEHLKTSSLRANSFGLNQILTDQNDLFFK